MADNPVPVLSSISPTNKPDSSGGFTVTCNGSGFTFIAGSVVRWDGSDRVTTLVGGNTVTAVILPEDLVAGPHNVTVFNPAPGGGESAAKVFAVTTPVVEKAAMNGRFVHRRRAGVVLQVVGGDVAPAGQLYPTGHN